MNARNLFGFVGCAVLALAGCGPVEMNYTLSEESQSLEASQQESLRAALVEAFGTPTDPKVPQSLEGVIKTSEQELAQGAVAFRTLCMHCHGLTGDGMGPTAGPKGTPFLNPLPRDYRRGTFKFTSTDSSAKPTREDLMRTVLYGIPGTSMPGFALYDQAEIERVVDYVILLAARGETERFVVSDFQAGAGELTAEAVADNAAVVGRNWSTADSKIVKPQKPAPVLDDAQERIASIERGRELFMSDRVQCFNCHGKDGSAKDWESSVQDPEKTTDVWGNRAKPADLTTGVFRGGGRPLDLFRRIHESVKGTPMPAQKGNLTEEQIWDLVAYVRNLAYEDRKVDVPDEAAKSQHN